MTTRTHGIPLRLTAVHKEALREEAERHGLSMNELIVLWIEDVCAERSPELRKYMKARAELQALEATGKARA